MAFTKHGHHIPGTVLGIDRPNAIARCGGPRICKKCREEAAAWFNDGHTVPLEIIVPPAMFASAAKSRDFVTQARYAVSAYYENKIGIEVPPEKVIVVIYTESDDSWRALLKTAIPDGTYYEVAYQGDTKEVNVDVYKKHDHMILLNQTS